MRWRLWERLSEQCGLRDQPDSLSGVGVLSVFMRSAIAATAAILLSLAGCVFGSPSSPPEPEPSPRTPSEASSPGEAFPVVIEHPWGSTVIAAKPERVAAIGWGNQDVALALGVIPVSFERQKSSDDPAGQSADAFPWTTEALARLGAQTTAIFDTTEDGALDFQAIAATNPDVILAAGYDPRALVADFERLSQIAPVVPPPDYYYRAWWRETIRQDSAALGLSAEGDAYIARIEGLIADATTGAGFEGKTAAFLDIEVRGLSTIGMSADDRRMGLLGDLGFDTPHAMTAVRDSGGRFAFVRADQLADVDIIVANGDGALLRALRADPGWSTVPAVKYGAVIALAADDDLSWAIDPTALSLPWALPAYVSLLRGAAARVK